MKPIRTPASPKGTATTNATNFLLPRWVLKRGSAGLLLVVLALFGLMIPNMKRAEAGGMAPLLLHAGGIVSVVRPDEKSVVTFSSDSAENAMLSFDGKFVATTKPGSNQSTVLEIRDPWTAKTVWTQTVPGNWRVEAVSSDARQVVLGDPTISLNAANVPRGRTTTSLLLVGDGVGYKQITLPGNFVAEAFLANGGGVALIEHLPPTNPVTYRVRPLGFYGDEQALLRPIGGLKTGLRGDPQTEEMQGTRLNQTWNDRGDALYTLYDSTGYARGEGVFVHALDLVTGLARCLDVPSDIDAGVGKGKVVFTGTHKLIVVGRKGIVRMNVQSGAIEQKLRVQTKEVGALFSQADKFYVSDQRTLLEYQVSTLRKLNTMKFDVPIVTGTIRGQMPPIVVDAKGSIWYAINDPVLRGAFPAAPTKDAVLVGGV
jgi:hypothetical protein